jgi:hypothetical protein
MKYLLVGGLMLLALGRVAAQNALLDFDLVNKTGYDIEAVYLAPNTSTDWGDDVLEGAVLKNNATLHLEFHPKAKAKLWDLSVGWVGYSAEEDVIWEKLDLTQIERLILHYDPKTNKTWAKFE